MDWMLETLPKSVPQTRHVVVLSADGMCIARYGADDGAAERLAAIGSGLKSLGAAAAEEYPHDDKQLRMIVIENGGGFFYLMAAGARAYLAVTADQGVDAGLMGQCMRDLVARIGEHLTTPVRGDGRVT
jgi:predicted regulator of Ras-like GTPase activity (Roadblock/LC7/MglB family)